jgi:hypothetical protein
MALIGKAHQKIMPPSFLADEIIPTSDDLTGLVCLI